MDDMIIDHMTGKEVSVCMEWAKAEGWNPGLHDADIFHRTDPMGFFAARMYGEMMGGISMVSYSSGFRFGGFLIVHLLSALVSRFPGEGFGLDVPVSNRQAVDLARRFGMKESFSTMRMYTREVPDFNIDHVFGITSFESG